jgi:hypothetical protein
MQGAFGVTPGQPWSKLPHQFKVVWTQWDCSSVVSPEFDGGPRGPRVGGSRTTTPEIPPPPPTKPDWRKVAKSRPGMHQAGFSAAEAKKTSESESYTERVIARKEAGMQVKLTKSTGCHGTSC